MLKLSMAEGSIDIEWSCPSCTFINKQSFKCRVCGTPKGTATRQMKFQFSSLEQQYVAESLQSTKAQSTRALTRLHAQQNSSPSSPFNSPPSPSSCSAAAASHSSDTSAAAATTTTTTTTTMTSTATGTSTTTTTTTTTSTTTTAATAASAVTGRGEHVKKRHRSRMNPMASTSLSPSKPKHAKLRNIDRSRILNSQKITVNDVTVTITEYPMLYTDSE